MNVQTVLVGDQIEFFNAAGEITGVTDLPANLAALEGILLVFGVHPDHIAQQAEDIRKQLVYDLDFVIF